MSNVNLESTTDSKDAVTAALGGKVEAKTEEVEAKEQTVSETEEATEETTEKVAAKGSGPEEKDTESDDDTKEALKAEDSESEDEESESEDNAEEKVASKDDKPKKRKGGFKRRIDKLTNKLSEAEREAQYWRDQAMRAKKEEMVDAGARETETVAKSDGRPDPDNFETHEEYLDALTDWKVDRRLEADKKAKAEEDLRKEQKTLEQAHFERVQSFVKDHDDFEEVLSEVDDIPMSPAVGELILKSDNGPELMYELAKDPEEFERINDLAPLAAARAIGRIEAGLSKSSETKKEDNKQSTSKVAQTKAPKPPSPVSKKASVSTKSPDEMDFQEYKRWRAQQRA